MAFAVFFRVLFNAPFAGRVQRLTAGDGEDATPRRAYPSEPPPPPPPAPAPLTEHDPTAALQLLALLQREGRLLDFLHEDIGGFGDADVGAAARVVHTGCKKVLDEHLTLRTVREEAEGEAVTLQADFPANEVRLTGNVTGTAPFRGTLAHRGWRAEKVTLPQLSQGHDAQVLAPAEVEL